MGSVWYSPRGIPVLTDNVDLEHLADLYATGDGDDAAAANAAWDRASLDTRHAWTYGWLNPRVDMDYATQSTDSESRS